MTWHRSHQAPCACSASTSQQRWRPRWHENAAVIEFYDDGEPTVIDLCKIVIGGGEDQIDSITGPDHINLGDVYTAISGSSIWTARTGFNYTDTDDQSTDTISFTPFLQRGSEAVVDGFLHSATIGVYAVDGGLLYDATDQALSTTVTGGLTLGGTTLVVADTSGYNAGDTIASGEELISITTVDSGTQLTVTRGTNGTIAAAHGDGEEVYRGAADSQGVFLCEKLGTSAMSFGSTYTLLVTITYRDESYTSSHSFSFVENDV